MKIITLTGMPGAGKDEVKKLILKIKDMPVFVMSSVVLDDMKKKGLPMTNEGIRNYATELRRKYGYDIVARKCAPMIDKIDADVVLIDGTRGPAEVDFFKARYGNDFHLIAVYASPKTRFERTKERGREGDAKKWEEFVFRDKKELTWGLGDVIAVADYVIVNEGTLKALESQVKHIMKQIFGG
jgi:dephospho-CoA kinase